MSRRGTKTATRTSSERVSSPPTKLHALTDEAKETESKASRWGKLKHQLHADHSDRSRASSKDSDEEERRRCKRDDIKNRLREEEEETRRRKQQWLLSEESQRRREMMARLLQEEQRRLEEDQREREEHQERMAHMDSQRRDEISVAEELKEECSRLLGCLKSPAKPLAEPRHPVLPTGNETVGLAQRIFGRAVKLPELEAVMWVQGKDRPRMRRVDIHEEPKIDKPLSPEGRSAKTPPGEGIAELAPTVASEQPVSTVFPYHSLHNIEVERQNLRARGRMLQPANQKSSAHNT